MTETSGFGGLVYHSKIYICKPSPKTQVFSRVSVAVGERRINIETSLPTAYVKREAGGVICSRGDTACVRAAIATANATRNSHEEGTPLGGACYTSCSVASPRSGT